MKKLWLNKANNINCILFFNGWGMDEKAVSHLQFSNFDICMYSDYSNLELSLTEIDSYESVFIVAWSLGVWVVSQVMNVGNLKITKAIAINGTELPINNEYGIPPEVFQGTLDFWNEINREKFNQRVFGGRTKLDVGLNKLPNRSIENQKAELAFLMNEIEEISETDMKWDVALIGTLDLIFSAKNQSAYWGMKTKVIEKPLPHYPFTDFTNWQQIIDL